MRTPDKLSPYRLVQERLPRDALYGWRVLCAAVLLNKVDGERAFDALSAVLASWPTPEALADAPAAALTDALRPLGLQARRAESLRSLSRRYVAADWTDPEELPGVGEYGAACWRIFVERELPDEEPRDPFLSAYWFWATRDRRQAALVPRARSGAAFEVGDALLTLDDATALSPGYSTKVLSESLLCGELEGRWVGGLHGWLTTWSALLDWARDRAGSARRRAGERPAQLAVSGRALVAWHARKRKERIDGEQEEAGGDGSERGAADG